VADILRLVNGVPTLLSTAPLGSTSSGILDFQVIGSSLRLLLDGGLVTTAFDTQIGRPGQVGLLGSVNASWVNFTYSSAAPSLNFADSFSRPNSSNLGSDWAQFIGSIGIQSNQADVTGSAGLNGAVYAGPVELDVDVSAAVSVPNVANATADAIARYAGPGDANYYMAAYTSNGTSYFAQLYRNVGGALTQLYIVQIGSGTGTIDLQVQGDLLRLSFNGTVLFTTTDTQIRQPGMAGIRGTVNATWSNLNVSPLVPRVSFGDAFHEGGGSLDSNWLIEAGSFTVSNNQAVAASSGTSLAIYAYDGQADAGVNATIALNTSGQIAELLARYAGPGDQNMYSGGVTDNGNGSYTAAIYYNNGGTRTLLASTSFSAGTSLSDDLSLDVVGGTLQLVLSDPNSGSILAQVSVANTQLTTLGAVGIRGSNGAAFSQFFVAS
jgi:hypothetical protein